MAKCERRGGFTVRHFVRNYIHNSKTKSGIKRFTYLTIALLPHISILLVSAVCEIRSASYESKEGTQLLFDATLCAYLHS